VRLRARDERLAYIVCRLDIPFPILQLASAPAAGHGVTIGPLGGGASVEELIEQLDSMFGLRHCGRRLPRRRNPSAYGQMGRCLSPCLGDLDPNLYRRRLDAALTMFLGADARDALLGHLEAQMRAAAAEQQYERAAALRRRRDRLAGTLRRVEGALAAVHARPRLVLAPHPVSPGRHDALWLAGGRLVDFGELPSEPAAALERTRAVLRRAEHAQELGAHVPPDEVDELRTVTSYLHGHPELPQLPLAPPPADAEVLHFVRTAQAQANGSETTSAWDPLPSSRRAPGSTSRRTKASAIGPKRGETAVLVTRATTRSS